jgi:hypothetical protein
MLLTYYCPKCHSIRQFIVEDAPPVKCGRLTEKVLDALTGEFSIEACDGELLPVRNVNFIIQDPEA